MPQPQPVPRTLPQTPRNRDDPPPPVAAVQDRVVSTNFVALATPGNMRLLAANVTVTATRTGPCRCFRDRCRGTLLVTALDMPARGVPTASMFAAQEGAHWLQRAWQHCAQRVW